MFRCRAVAYIVLALEVGCVARELHGSADSEWELWKMKHNRSYQTAEEEANKKDVWKERYDVYREHTGNPDRTYEMEMNELTDLIVRRDAIEFKDTEIDQTSTGNLGFVPTSWDWRTKRAITPVINEYPTGDTLATAAQECVTSYLTITHGPYITVSGAEVHDCCTQVSKQSPHVFTCIHDIGGLCAQSDYPQASGTCRNDTCIPIAKINGGQQSTKGDEEALKEAVYNMPVMALIDASHSSFLMYKSGVYTESSCTTTQLDHAVQIVGYGSTQDDQEYWILKNSWGTNWGLQGYMWLARNKDNMCGIATAAYYPV